MAVYHTMTTKVTSNRQHARLFALVWIGITLLFGAGTFLAVYLATGAVNNTTAGLPFRNDAGQAAVVVQITATPLPTLSPDQITPINPVATAAEAATSAPAQPPAGPTPTTLAIKDDAFDLGIAVQKTIEQESYKIWVNAVRDDLKLNWVKSQVVWRDTEKVKGQIDFGELDVAVNMLHDNNIKVMLSITKAPDWARDPGAPIDKPGQFDGPPANPQDLADFVTAILQRYPGKVQAIEVWNEINLDREWSTVPKALDAKRYVELLRVTGAAIKAIDPNIVVISAALSPTGANIPGVAMDDFMYMDQLIAAGVLQYADCVGVHHNGLNVPPTATDWRNIPERTPRAKYRGPWENPNHSWSFRATLEGYHERIQKAGGQTKLCITEFGWPSMEDLTTRGKPRQGFEFAYDNTLQDQSDFTKQALDFMHQSGYVRLAFLWNLNYGAQVGWSLDGAVGDNVLWSIMGPDWTKRPVWTMLANRNYRAQPR